MDCVNTIDISRLKVGTNILVNRLTCINGLIKYDCMNLTMESYKIKCKTLFLTWDVKTQIKNHKMRQQMLFL